VSFKEEGGEYRDAGKTECFESECSRRVEGEVGVVGFNRGGRLA
jgi:hypothetical protein